MKNFRVIYHIVTRGEGDKSKKYWNRVGTAWENKDGSVNLEFDEFPCDGGKNLQIRDYVEKEKDFG